jgi:hypothetical protein
MSFSICGSAKPSFISAFLAEWSRGENGPAHTEAGPSRGGYHAGSAIRRALLRQPPGPIGLAPSSRDNRLLCRPLKARRGSALEAARPGSAPFERAGGGALKHRAGGLASRTGLPSVYLTERNWKREWDLHP